MKIDIETENLKVIHKAFNNIFKDSIKDMETLNEEINIFRGSYITTPSFRFEYRI